MNKAYNVTLITKDPKLPDFYAILRLLYEQGVLTENYEAVQATTPVLTLQCPEGHVPAVQDLVRSLDSLAYLIQHAAPYLSEENQRIVTGGAYNQALSLLRKHGAR